MSASMPVDPDLAYTGATHSRSVLALPDPLFNSSAKKTMGAAVAKMSSGCRKGGGKVSAVEDILPFGRAKSSRLLV